MKLSTIIQDKQQYLADFQQYFNKIRTNSLEKHPEKLAELSAIRGIPIEVLHQHELFYIDSYEELLHPEYLDKLRNFGLINNVNNLPVFHERWVIPIKNFDNKIINLVGYSPYYDNRYLYANGLYYNRKDDMFGMENYKHAYELGWAIYVEGITDCLALRSLGYKNAFASCGTMSSKIKMRHLNMLPFGTIFITDRDKAGQNVLKHWKTHTCVYMSISIELQLKDIDDYINKQYVEGSKIVLPADSELRYMRATTLQETVEASVDWLKTQVSIKNDTSKHANITLI